MPNLTKDGRADKLIQRSRHGSGGPVLGLNAYGLPGPTVDGKTYMIEETISLRHSDGKGFVIPLGSINLVGVVARKGMVGCGAFDVSALNNFAYPAAKVRPVTGPSIVTIADLLSGEIREANAAAQGLGITTGMTGKAALDLLS